MANDDLLGQKIGTYRVLRRLGSGGMGAVYLAEHPDIGKRVAIKVLHAEASSNRSIVDRFFAEAKAVNVIGHPNIVDIIDLSRLSDGRSYLVMEYLEGASLAQFLKAHGALRLDDALPILLPVCEGLAAAHERGIIHRDLKPDNIFLVARPNQEHLVKLLDFGVAKLTPAAGGVQATQAGALMGTPQYMSPEQALGRNADLDARSDVFQLGVIFYKMLSSKLPFEETSIGGLLMAIVQAVPRPLRELRPDLPAALLQIVDRALAKQREDRFASAGALGSALRVVADDRRGPHRPLPLPSPERLRTPASGVPARRSTPGPSGPTPAPVIQPAPLPIARASGASPSKSEGPLGAPLITVPATAIPVGGPRPALLPPSGSRQAISAASALPPEAPLAEGTPLAANSPLSSAGKTSGGNRIAITLMIGLLLGLAAAALFVLHRHRQRGPVAHVEAPSLLTATSTGGALGNGSSLPPGSTAALPAGGAAAAAAPGGARPLPASLPSSAPTTAASLPAATATLSITSIPPGADVVLTLDGSALPPLTTPASVQLPAGASVTLVVSHPGYVSVTRAVTVGDGSSIDVPLAKAPEKAATKTPSHGSAPLPSGPGAGALDDLAPTPSPSPAPHSSPKPERPAKPAAPTKTAPDQQAPIDF